MIFIVFYCLKHAQRAIADRYHRFVWLFAIAVDKLVDKLWAVSGRPRPASLGTTCSFFAQAK
ncbi:hypothetical protein PSEUDO9AG_10532 [Pseudomonas sp. 9Ag]|nr:hypothetical protein PSEUDO9AG_10532 [Pseudomonas sp. 9Ag]